MAAKISKIGLCAFWLRDVYDPRFAGITPSGRPVLPPVAGQISWSPHISIPVRTGRTRRKRHVQANCVYADWSQSCSLLNGLLLPQRVCESLQSVWWLPLNRWLLPAAEHDDADDGWRSSGLLFRSDTDRCHEWCHHGRSDHGFAWWIHHDGNGPCEFADSLLIAGMGPTTSKVIQPACRTRFRVRRAVFLMRIASAETRKCSAAPV